MLSFDEHAIRAYLKIKGASELARLAAMMTPKGMVFDARVQIAQAAALQVEAEAHLIRCRKAVADSMDHNTLVEVCRRLGMTHLDSLSVYDRDFVDPVAGPVLERLREVIRALPLPQDFHDQFLSGNPTAALKLASERTTIPRPLLGESLEDSLRYASNIPNEEISWELLNRAFFDFLRIRLLYPALPQSLFPENPEADLSEGDVSQIFANLHEHLDERNRFQETFMPGQVFPSEIELVAIRAYQECWENGLGHLWPKRLAWLAEEFTPFWDKHGNAYRALQKESNKVLAAKKKKKSVAGKAGASSREDERWKTVTKKFVTFLQSHPKKVTSKSLPGLVTKFVNADPSFGGARAKTMSLEILHALCTGVIKKLKPFLVLNTLQRSLLVRYEALELIPREQKFASLTPTQLQEYRERGTTPSDWIKFKSLSEDTVRDCLHILAAAYADTEK